MASTYGAWRITSPISLQKGGKDKEKNRYRKKQDRKKDGSQVTYKRVVILGKVRKPFTCLYCYNCFCDFDRFQRHKKRHAVARWQPKQQLADEDVNMVIMSQYEYSSAIAAGEVDEYPLAMTEGNTDYSLIASTSEIVHQVTASYGNGIINSDMGMTLSKYVECLTCGKCFGTSTDLNRHELIHFGIKLYPCEYCSKEFSNKGNLDRHLATHTRSKPFGCEQCDKQFSRKGDLKRHTSIHIGDKPYNCQSCTMSFRVKDALNKHIDRMHSMIKPYQCPYCGKYFSRTDDFGRHVRAVHEAPIERLFSCGYCGKSFQTKDHLSKHEVVHTGAKPFGCGVCGKNFSRKYDVKRHHLKRHGHDPFQCVS